MVNQKREEDNRPKGKESVVSSEQPSGIQQIQVSCLYLQQKRKRRTANEIERRYKCSVENCGKSYGSKGSLNQHIKFKHPDLYLANAPKPAEENFENNDNIQVY